MVAKKLKMLASALVAGALCISGLALLAGCSSAENEASSSAVVEEAIQAQEPAEEPAVIDSTRFNYSEGLAWVKFEQGGEDWLGVMDKKGNVQFKLSGDIPGKAASYLPTDFENGYSYLRQSVWTSTGSTSLNTDLSSCWVIDSEGSVCGYYEDVAAFGAGYLVQERYEDGFDAESYSYDILDANGNVLNTYALDGDEAAERTNVRYCGRGVFEFDPFGDDVVSSLYFANFDTFVDEEGGNWEAVTFDKDDDISVARLNCNYDVSYYQWTVTTITSEGVTNEIDLSSTGVRANDVTSLSISDGVLLVASSTYSVGDAVFSYGLESGKLSRLSDEYANKIDGGYKGFSDGRIVLPMKGADGNRYIAIFDKEWNVILEPTKEPFSYTKQFSGDVLVATSGDVSSATPVYDFYNDNCEIVHTLDLTDVSFGTGAKLGSSFLSNTSASCEFNTSASIGSGFCDGVLCVNSSDYPYYVDADGSRLFTELNTSSARDTVLIK